MKPDLSVVIATYDRMSRLERTLRSLALQTHKNFEVIIASDGGNIETPVLVSQFAHRLRIRHIWATPPEAAPNGAAKTRNAAFRLCKAVRVLVTDDDCICPPGLVAEHCKYGEKDISVIGLRRHLPIGTFEGLTEEQLAQIASLPYTPEMRDNKPTLARLTELSQRSAEYLSVYAWTCHVSWPMRAVVAAGGMWEQMKGSGHEDFEFALRVHRNGAPHTYRPDLVVYHQDHPKCQYQTAAWQANKTLALSTLNNPRIRVRNGGPLQLEEDYGTDRIADTSVG